LAIAVLRAWGNGDDPRVQYIHYLINWAHDELIATASREEPIDWLLNLLVPEVAMKEIAADIRRGDMVRLTNGKVVQVVSTQGGYIFTTDGTYGSWQVEKIAKA
jgi:hypothetical protein